MKLKKNKIDLKSEKDIITGLIVSDLCCRNIIPVISTANIFKSNITKTVFRWCKEYFTKYEKAPYKDIQKIFDANSKNLEEEDSDLISSFLENISENFNDSFNAEYNIDESIKTIKARNIEILKNEIDYAAENGDLLKAEQLIANFTHTEKPIDSGVSIFDRLAIIDAFDDENNEKILELPGVLGDLISPLEREDFLAVTAPMKRGKTFWLEEFANQILFKSKNVVFFSLEMPQRKIIQRLYQNYLGETKKPTTIEIPYFDGNDIEYKTVQKHGIRIDKALKKAVALKKMTRSGKFKLICLPAHSLNVEKIKQHLDIMKEHENFIPDAIVIDYADIMIPEPYSSKEKRHQIDETWKCLRGLAQERKCLIITATQSSRSGFSKNIEQEEVSEDIRKLAHVTAMIALNQTKEEKKENIMRISVLAERESEFHVDDEVTVLQHLGIAKPYLGSRWSKDVIKN